MTLGMVHIGTFRNKEFGQFNVVFLAGHQQRRSTRLVGGIVEHRALFQQQLGDRQAAREGRRMKRGEAARVARHDVGTLAQQEFGDFRLVVERCSDEEGCLVACPAVDVGTACQGLLHGSLVAGSDGVEQQLTCGYSCSRQYQHYKCQQSAHRVE